MFNSKELFNRMTAAGITAYKCKIDPDLKGISQSTITRLKKGEDNISISSIEAIAKAMNMQPLELLQGIWTIDLSETANKQDDSVAK